MVVAYRVNDGGAIPYCLAGDDKGSCVIWLYPFFVARPLACCSLICSVCWQYYGLCRHFVCQSMSAKCLKIRQKVLSVRNLLVYLPAFMRVMHPCVFVLLGAKCVRVSDLECK